jgi:hypothetical protein
VPPVDAGDADRDRDGDGNGGADLDVVDVDVEADDDAAELSPEEIDRVYALLERAFQGDALEEPQLDRLLNVLERAIAGPSATNPRDVAELVAVLEEAIVAPEDLEGVDVDGVLSIVENAVVGATGANERTLQEAFDVLEEGIRDPSGLDPDDVEQFRSGLESAILEVTDPTQGGLGALFPLFGAGAGIDPAEVEEVDGDTLEVFRIARIGAAMTQRATGYSLESGVRTGTRMAYAVANAGSPAELLTETRAITLDELRRAGVDIGEQRADWLDEHDEELVDDRPMTRERLQERGQRLISKSAEVGREESFHPAFPSILEAVAPDEARILRLLATEGDQPAVDVRDEGYVPLQSTTVAETLTMVGSDAGCRHTERTAVYLENLQRLGLVAADDDPVDDLKRYQVLEAQPHVEKARDVASRPKTDYGSVRLTAFGAEFCETCLPVDVVAERPESRFRQES